jgi:hypothetical protein
MDTPQHRDDRNDLRDVVVGVGVDAAQRAQLLVVGMGGDERPQEVLISSVALGAAASDGDL